MRLVHLAHAACLVALVACSSAEEGSTAATAGAASDAKTEVADGTYDASCGDKYGSIELHLEVARGAVAKLTGKVDGRNGKLRPGASVLDWSATFETNLTRIDHPGDQPSWVALEGDGSLDYQVETRHMSSEDEDSIETTGNCSSPGSFPGLEILAKDDDIRGTRSVKLTHVSFAKDSCVAEDGPLDELRDWEIFCGEDEGGVESEGLDKLVAALRAAKAAPAAE